MPGADSDRPPMAAAEASGSTTSSRDVLRGYEDAAAKGDEHAAWNASVMLARGVGASVDRGRALAYLERAAEGGVVPAQVHLAFLLASGRGGVGGADAAAAAKWYAAAAAAGDATANYRLGGLHRSGSGVARDDARALACYDAAARAGHARASAKAAEIRRTARLAAAPAAPPRRSRCWFFGGRCARALRPPARAAPEALPGDGLAAPLLDRVDGAVALEMGATPPPEPDTGPLA